MDPKSAARARIERGIDGLVALSHRIHAHPELGFEEERSSRWTADALQAGGLDVDFGPCDVPTAFVARAGSGPLHVAICAEYDCLPDIGHACGHNIIAAAAVGAGLALREVADDAGLTVSIVGTPAEEGGGGKILLLERGAFEGVHAAMMVHPAPTDVVLQPMLAVAHLDVRYRGVQAHASAFPELGINAADALTVAQVSIGLLRQHIRPTDRVHGIVTKGGEAPNIVPGRAAGSFYVRAQTTGDLGEILSKVKRCFEAGALATGATLEIDEKVPYAEMKPDADIGMLYRRNSEALGRRYREPGVSADRASGSTDMGNVSQAIPSIHPMIGINSLPAVNHQPEFATHCVTPYADKAIVDGAIAMAWTAIDMAADGALRTRLAATGGG